jgi:polysaccharide export outer membrane protein
LKRVLGIFLVVLFISFMIPHSTSADEYRLVSGDIISISIWGHEELEVKELVIRPDGQISVPLAGEIRAAGLSTAQVTNSIVLALSEYIKNPKAAVNVLKFGTTRVYVLGEVVKPGLYEIEKRHNLLDAISIAGGYTKNAAKKKVCIIPNGQTSHSITANLIDLLKKGDMTQNYVLGDGDVVYLSDNGRISFAADILPWITGGYQIKKYND